MKPMGWMVLFYMAMGIAPVSAIEVVSLAPNQGAPGTLVEVGGGPFSGATEVFLGERFVPPLRVNESSLEFTVPYLRPGNYLLTVQNDRDVAEQNFNFEVLAPTPLISNIDPQNLDVCRPGPEAPLQVAGRNFLEGAVVLIDDVVVPTTFAGPASLEARLQGSRRPGVYGVKVRNPDGATSLPHSLWIDSIPEIISVEQGNEFVNYYEVVIHGKNFLASSTLVVREPDDSLIGQAWRQFSFGARPDRGGFGGGNTIAPQRDRLVYVDCQTLIYYRYSNISQEKELELTVINPEGHKTDPYFVSLP